MLEPETRPSEVVLPDHFGFCEGVVAADDLLRDVAAEARAHGIEHVYGYHDVVHNQDVVREHEANGVIFVDDVDAIPPQSIVVTSAHGIGPEVRYALREKESELFDAACPLVLHTHTGVAKARENGEKVIYVCHGKPGTAAKLHDEVIGIMGHLDYYLDESGQLVSDPLERAYAELDEEPEMIQGLLSDSARYRVISQTTLDSEGTFRYRDQLEAYIKVLQPDASVSMSKPGDVCRAVTYRQAGVKQLLQLKPGRLVVVTDKRSKNGMGYKALAEAHVAENGLSTEVVAVANLEEAKKLGRIDGLTGITASASTPDRTTFAVAQELGLDELPDVVRKPFGLKDARGDNVRRRIGEFALLRGQLSSTPS